MKTPKQCVYIVLLLLLFSGFTAPSFAAPSSHPASLEEVKKETQDVLDALKNYTADQRDEALQKTRKALDKLDKRIKILETQVGVDRAQLSETARKKTDAALKELHKQRREVAEWSRRLKNSSTDAWDQMKKGFTEAYRAFHHSWEKTEKEFSEHQ